MKKRFSVEEIVGVLKEPLLPRYDLEAKIVKHCREDEGFRREVTSDPRFAPPSSLPSLLPATCRAVSKRPFRISPLRDDLLAHNKLNYVV
jgi:hypothetical protein